MTVSPVRDDEGNIIGASKVARDITASRVTQRSLREREAHLQYVLDTIPDAMVVIDTGGIVQSFSTTAEKQFGYDAGEVIGRNVNLLMPYSSVTAKPPKHGNLQASFTASSRSWRNSFQGSSGNVPRSSHRCQRSTV